MRAPQRPLALALSSLLGTGCAYGVRGGAETVVYSTGAVLTQATATGYAGFGSRRRDGTRSDGILGSLTLTAGADAREGDFTAGVGAGIEGFSMPEREGARWGYHLGAGLGGRARGAYGEWLGELRGGPMVRLGTREGTGAPLLTLGLDATLGIAAPLREGSGEVAAVFGLALTVGMIDVRYFHL